MFELTALQMRKYKHLSLKGTFPEKRFILRLKFKLNFMYNFSIIKCKDLRIYLNLGIGKPCALH